MDADATVDSQQIAAQKQQAGEFLKKTQAAALAKYDEYQTQGKQRSNVRNDETLSHETMPLHNDISNAVDKVLALKYNSTYGMSQVTLSRTGFDTKNLLRPISYDCKFLL